jgi:hypothetical protein
VIEEPGSDQAKQSDDKTAKIVPAPLINSPTVSQTPPVEPRDAEKKVAGESANADSNRNVENAEEKGKSGMSPFERRIAIIGIILGTVTAFFFWVQLKEMTYQTQVLASQSEGANAGALMDEMNTRKQLSIASTQAIAAQTQATAAQDSVKAIQGQATIARQLAQEDRRPWVGTRDFECGKCATIPKETNPYDGRTPVTVEEITWGDMSIFLENSGRTPAIDMNFSSFFGILRTKSQPIPDYDSILAELTPKTIPDEYAKQVEIVKKFTGLISTVLPPHSSRKIEMPQQGAGGRRLNVPIPEQTVTYVLGRITYSGPDRRKQFITNFCLMNEKGVEFRFCPSGNDMK